MGDEGPSEPVGPPAPFAQGIEIIAHRGYSARAPENTVAAIRMALEAGAPAVEWDIQVSASGTAYVFHDDTLDRTTDGEGAFADCTEDMITSLDAGAWFDPVFTGEAVPTLVDALAALDGRARRVYPEIKTFRSKSHVDDIVAQVRESGWLERAVFISIDWDALGQVRRVAPEVHVGYIVAEPARYEDAIERALDDPRAIVDPDYRIALSMPEMTRKASGAGIPLAVWTVNEPARATDLLALGVRGFTTNEVGLLLDWATNSDHP